MKKSLILGLVLTLAISGCAVYAAADIWSQHDAVTFRQNILTGDSADADGLTVHLELSERGHQFWTAAHTLGTNPQTEVTYDYTLLEDGDRVLGPVRADETEPVALWTAPSDSFSEQMEFYPLQGNLQFPEIHVSWTEDAWWSSVQNKKDQGAMARALDEAFQEFFKIPIPHGLQAAQNHSFRLFCDSVLTEDACYFVFNAENYETGGPLDVSQIKGGFGIYRLPYNSQKGILPELSTIYPIDPAAAIQHLEISPSQDALHLHTAENGHYMITFIDLATGQELQKLDVGNLDIPSKTWNVITGENWILLRNGRLEYILLSSQPDGAYAETLHLDIPLSEVPWDEEKADAIVATSDGSRIALASSTYNYYYNGGDFFTAIYGSDGLEYYAEYESSLRSQSRDSYIRTGDLQLEWR